MRRIPPWPPFAESTDGFKRVYEEVTKRMREFQAAQSETEAEWIDLWIVGFQEEFDSWATSPRVREYLEMVHTRAKASSRWSDALRLVGYVYLHVVYDLPRVLAVFLLGKSPQVRGRARAVFREMRPLVVDALETKLIDPQVVGSAVGWIGKFRFIRRGDIYRSVMIGLGEWISFLRNEAWLNAETIADGHGYRQQLEKDLWKQITIQSQALRNMPAHPQNWLSQLDSSPVLEIPHRDVGDIADVVDEYSGVPRSETPDRSGLPVKGEPSPADEPG